MFDIYNQLKADFPPDAYSIDSSRGFALTSIKAQYVNERLNDVLGITGWEFDGAYEECETGVLFHGVLRIYIGDTKRRVTHTGYSAKKKNLGDSYKSARTDALGKCASLIGVGNEVFKGNVKASSDGKTFRQTKRQETQLPTNRGTVGTHGSSRRSEGTERTPGISAGNDQRAGGDNRPANTADSGSTAIVKFDFKNTDHVKSLEEEYRNLYRKCEATIDSYEDWKKKYGARIVKKLEGTPVGFIPSVLPGLVEQLNKEGR